MEMFIRFLVSFVLFNLAIVLIGKAALSPSRTWFEELGYVGIGVCGLLSLTASLWVLFYPLIQASLDAAY